VGGFLTLLRAHREKIVESEYQVNPWSPETAPQLVLK
jgi:hypothetical protein